ncbi:MAG: UbiA family prenyltransferase [Planctomycetes bacterium]|nr:UbiA family prenyltransferase [Planctomycetota bacterium]
MRRGRLAVYWQFVRPFTLLPPLLGMVSGAVSAIGAVARHRGRSFFEEMGEHGLTHGKFILVGSLMAATLNAASNVFNQWTDLENDRINKPNRPLPAGLVTVRETVVLFLLLYAVSLASAYFVTPLEGAWWRRHQCFVIAALGAIGTWIYSGHPFRTKRWGWPAQLTIAIPRGCLLKVCGWTCVATAFGDPEPWFIGAVFFLFLLGASATKDFADMKGDAAAGCVTLPIRYGVRSAARQISPFFVLPWLLLPLGVLLTRGDFDGDGRPDPILSGNPWALAALGLALVAYGLYTVSTILRNPEELATTENHPSWTHMYRMMMLAQVGFAAAYLF